MSYTANSSQPQTRHKSATATVQQRNKEQALALLRTREYLVPGEPINPSDLSYALLQFAYGAKLSKAITDIISRAFAFANKEQALALLRTREYLVPGEPINPSDLSYALLQFAYRAKLSKAITDIISRAFAFAMTDIGVHHMAEDLVSTVKTQLSDQMELYNTQVETMRDAVENVTRAAKEI
ncbi:hypothetical protein BYT27DRAFT_7111085, partial [Phlegmacium glaucopus]